MVARWCLTCGKQALADAATTIFDVPKFPSVHKRHLSPELVALVRSLLFFPSVDAANRIGERHF
jgi:hypothetical protein